MTRLLQRLMVVPVFRRHAALFAFVLFGALGAVKAASLADYHAAIMRLLLSSWGALAAVLLLWAAWMLRATRSGLRLLAAPEGRFLHTLGVWSTNRILLLFLGVSAQWALPLAVYAIPFAAFAVTHGFIAKGLVIIAALPVMVGIAAGSLRGAITLAAAPGPRAPIRQRRRRPLPFVLWPAMHLLRSEARGLLVVKCFSLLLLYVPLVWNRDRYAHDSLPLFLIALNIANSWCAWRCVRFVEGPLRFYRNLPVRSGVIFAMLALTFALVLLPEALYLVWAGRGLLTPLTIAGIWMAPYALLLFLAATQYGHGTGRSELLKLLGGISFISLFFFNGEWYGRWVAVLLSLSVFLYFYNHRTYEEQSAPE